MAAGAGGGGAYPFVACLSHMTIDHASLLRRSTVPTPNRDTSNFWALITLFLYITSKLFANLIPFVFGRLCGHHLSPRIAIVFSLLTSVSNYRPTRIRYYIPRSVGTEPGRGLGFEK